MADARPSRVAGVTVCRSVAVLMTQMIGPVPSSKKPSPASHATGIQIVSTMRTDAANPATGPSTITRPNGSARMIRGASAAPSTMPTP